MRDGRAPLYDAEDTVAAPGIRTLLERHLQRPINAALLDLRNRLDDMNESLQAPAALDQYDDRAQPFAYQRWYGPIPLTTPRRYDNSSNGFEKLATVASPATFYLPRQKGNIRTHRGGRFKWEETAIHSYISWTWSSNVDIVGFDFQTFNATGDLFDPTIPMNGGAMLMNNNRYVDLQTTGANEVLDVPNASFELGLYDKTRNRYLHDGDRLPSALFSGQSFINRIAAEPMALDSNTEIEPQLYVDEVRIRNVLNTDTLFNACLFRLWVSLTLLGTLEQE